MKVSVQDKEGLFKSLTVNVEGEIVQKAINEVHEYLKENAYIEGFRKGSAPLWIIKIRYKESIKEEVGKKVADATLEQAIKEAKLKPAATIYLENVELQEDPPSLSYTVTFEVLPEFELKDVEGLEIEIPKIEFSEKMVEEALEKIRQEHIIWEPVNRPVKKGDMVSIQYQVEELTSGEKTEGETSGVVGEKMFREEIDTALEGKSEGDTLYLTELSLYDTEGKEAGKANVKVTVKSVKQKVLPDIDDDLAKQAGLGNNLQEAMENLRKSIQENLQKVREEAIQSAIARKLVEMHHIEVPKTLLAKEIESLLTQRLNYLAQYGIDPKHVDVKAISEEIKPQAIFNIKLRLILDKYAQIKNINVSEEDMQKKYEELATMNNTSAENIKAYFESQNLVPVVMSDILREKAIRELIQKAVIKEVQKEEIKNEGNT